jgi:hypothetical protein
MMRNTGFREVSKINFKIRWKIYLKPNYAPLIVKSDIILTFTLWPPEL